MNSVFTIIAALGYITLVSADCTNIPVYNETFTPACDANDVYVKWPNYLDPTTYYTCNGLNNPQLVACTPGLYFTFVLQQCVTCANYLPAVECSKLKTENPPNCVPIGSTSGTTSSPSSSTAISGAPTPEYPTTAASTTIATTTTVPTTTTKKTTTIKTTTTTTTITTTPDSTTTTCEPVTTTTPGATEFPPPPTPPATNPDVPTPPTEAPTPPAIDDQPPTAAPSLPQ